VTESDDLRASIEADGALLVQKDQGLFVCSS
jgi:hypothetical protein